MKWRALLPVLLGLLIASPLMWLLHSMTSGYDVPLPVPHGRSVVPMLSPEERLRLRTYDQECQTDGDCEPPLRCTYDRMGRGYCSDSECRTERDCGRDYVCRAQGVINGKDLRRACSRVGERKEGEICESFPDIREEGCERGLLCPGFCGRPCRLDETASCPEGFTCKEGLNGPSCVPTCEGRSCPDGQRCITGLLGGIGSVCMKVYGQDCDLTPCPQGLHCTRIPSTTNPGNIWMECLRGCGGKEDSPCPEGSACFLFQCRRACDPHGPPSCAPGFACGQQNPSQPWVCRPSSRSE
jgi:hypothetical protein